MPGVVVALVAEVSLYSAPEKAGLLERLVGLPGKL